MKNIVLSAVAVIAMSSFAVAGGDIAPIEEPEVIVEEVVAPDAIGGAYIGIGYGFLNAQIDEELRLGVTDTNWNVLDESFAEIMIQAGYQFNAYVGVEGRYWFGLDTSTRLFGNERNSFDDDVSIDAWGIYVKPMYPVTEAFNVYALLGYGAADLTIDNLPNGAEYTTDDINGFSWGLGVSYTFTNNVELFVDYVSIYSDTTDVDNAVAHGMQYSTVVDSDINTINVGVSYRF